MTVPGGPRWIDAAALRRAVPTERAVAAIGAALAGGLDPEDGPDRTAVPLPAGEFLIMPAAGAGYAGTKVATVAPGNPARGLPRIQGLYLLFDAGTLTPLAVLDGAALTLLRTAAVSAVAVRHLAPPEASRLVVFGTGPQAWEHLAALRAVRPLTSVGVVGRDPDRTRGFVRRLAGAGLEAEAVAAEAVAGADLIVCCTTAREPLFPGRLVPGHAVVVAVGSHEADAREVDGDLVARATVVVEARSAALREAGDVMIPLKAGTIGPDHPVGDLAELVRGFVKVPANRPRLFKSVGMAWEDLVVAAAAHEALSEEEQGDGDTAPAHPARGGGPAEPA
ncbi:ornithine cyclodeaminase family protein [Rhizohabitans arisaemae]|uniref:ornithine cyclodeaminase family protein n=1 Tax=Rhizohabitans arisaemae TaxID=2720610 RepID=UPI0024B0673E|nr:ornithine cyclodeaminase family protein [Rhizohabitans arisaemae]